LGQKRISEIVGNYCKKIKIIYKKSA